MDKLETINPYGATVQSVDEQYKHLTATRLAEFRNRPITIWRAIRASEAARTFLIGTLTTGIAAIGYYFGPLSESWPFGVATFSLGALAKDFVFVRHAPKLWPAQLYFIDWGKVDEVLGQQST